MDKFKEVLQALTFYKLLGSLIVACIALPASAQQLKSPRVINHPDTKTPLGQTSILGTVHNNCIITNRHVADAFKLDSESSEISFIVPKKEDVDLILFADPANAQECKKYIEEQPPSSLEESIELAKKYSQVTLHHSGQESPGVYIGTDEGKLFYLVLDPMLQIRLGISGGAIVPRNVEGGQTVDEKDKSRIIGLASRINLPTSGTYLARLANLIINKVPFDKFNPEDKKIFTILFGNGDELEAKRVYKINLNQSGTMSVEEIITAVRLAFINANPDHPASQFFLLNPQYNMGNSSVNILTVEPLGGIEWVQAGQGHQNPIPLHRKS